VATKLNYAGNLETAYTLLEQVSAYDNMGQEANSANQQGAAAGDTSPLSSSSSAASSGNSSGSDRNASSSYQGSPQLGEVASGVDDAFARAAAMNKGAGSSEGVTYARVAELLQVMVNRTNSTDREAGAHCPMADRLSAFIYEHLGCLKWIMFMRCQMHAIHRNSNHSTVATASARWPNGNERGSECANFTLSTANTTTLTTAAAAAAMAAVAAVAMLTAAATTVVVAAGATVASFSTTTTKALSWWTSLPPRTHMHM